MFDGTVSLLVSPLKSGPISSIGRSVLNAPNRPRRKSRGMKTSITFRPEKGILGRDELASWLKGGLSSCLHIDFRVGQLLAVDPDSPLGVSKDVEIRMSSDISNKEVMHTVKSRQYHSSLSSDPPPRRYCSGDPSDLSARNRWSQAQHRQGQIGTHSVGQSRWY